MQEIVARLKQAKVFEGLVEEEFHALAQAFTIEEFSAGTSFIHENEFGDEIFIIVQGRVEVYMNSIVYQDSPVSLALLSAHDTVGEFALVRPGCRRTANAQALTNVVVLKSSVRFLETIFDANPRAGMVFFKRVFERSVERLANTSLSLRNALM